MSDDARRAVAGELTRAVDAGIGASAIVTMLADHGVMPLAYRHLLADGVARLPPALEAELSAEFRRHVSSRFILARHLREVLTALENEGIPAVPFKGPALAIQLHGNFAMRQYGDIDLLVDAAHVDAARERLVAAGLIEPSSTTPAWRAYFRQRRHAESFVTAGGLLIELHWSVADRFYGVNLPAAWLMEGTASIDLLGRQTRVIHGARLLLALCLHGAKHLWARAIWLAEIATLIERTPDLDWATTFRTADRLDLGRSLRACLLLIEQWGGRLPTACHPYLRERGAARLAAAIHARLLSGDPAAGGLADQIRLGCLAREGVGRRLAFCWRAATDLSEHDAQGADAPPSIPVLHAVRRTWRIVKAARLEG